MHGERISQTTDVLIRFGRILARVTDKAINNWINRRLLYSILNVIRIQYKVYLEIRKVLFCKVVIIGTGWW